MKQTPPQRRGPVQPLRGPSRKYSRDPPSVGLGLATPPTPALKSRTFIRRTLPDEWMEGHPAPCDVRKVGPKPEALYPWDQGLVRNTHRELFAALHVLGPEFREEGWW